MRFINLIVIIAAVVHIPYSSAIVIPNPPEMGAKGYILIDYNSGKVLAASNENVQLAPASLTKLMTAYVVGQEIESERLSWKSSVVVSRKAWSANFPESSKMFIKPGDRVTVKELMLGLIVQSGNDAAVALAEHVAGTEDAFVSLMNGWAKSLGMSNTNFVNSHGLDDQNLLTTPSDMAKLLRAIIRDVPDVYSLYKERSFEWAGIQQYNRNKLLWDKSLNVDGGKTGFTENAGYSLASSALQGRMRLIAIVMGTPSQRARVNESRQLLNYGFRFFETLQVAQSDEVIFTAKVWQGDKDSVPVIFDEDIYITLPRNQAPSLKQEIEIDDSLKAPLNQGAVIGRVIWTIDDREIKVVDVKSAEKVERGSLLKRLKDTIVLWLSELSSKIQSLFGGAL
ncbi:D-alanyl-D-alanine carboxypeptidase family protein [Vibrio sp. M60_M70]|uniref:D-alanyl-D-alanine carboxypeptidase family protein n=1 Tax=Vibrio sp. M60_M70 TaxID=3035166 RepID=UPI00301DE28D